jgi:hypothetical protein
MDAGPSPPPSSRSAAERIRGSPNTKFRNAASSVVSELDQHIGEPYSILRLHTLQQLKSRRLYDVMNVFSAIGCARRLSREEIVWVGRDAIMAKLQQEKTALGVSNEDVPMSHLFPSENSVGLTSLTIAFLMLFPALGTREIDLREASWFFARTTKKYKTVLCNLYQIAVILGALGLTDKTKNMCEVRMLPPLEPLLADDESPISIGKLLNRPTDGAGKYKVRRAEYKSFAQRSGKFAARVTRSGRREAATR